LGEFAKYRDNVPSRPKAKNQTNGLEPNRTEYAEERKKTAAATQ
jgi:hypothetical protein